MSDFRVVTGYRASGLRAMTQRHPEPDTFDEPCLPRALRGTLGPNAESPPPAHDYFAVFPVGERLNTRSFTQNP
jgi:hypothetical protein